MIFELDGSGKISSFNAAGEAILGLPREAVIGRSLGELIAPGESERLNASLHPSASPFEMTFKKADGETAVLEVSARPIERAGQLVGFQAIGRDVTQRKQLEESLRQSAKMQAIGQLAGGIAHDFNNLLTVINGFSEMILSQLDPVSPLFESMEEISKAGTRAAGLTQQLLAFSRRSIVAPRIFSLNESVHDMEKMLHRLIGETIKLVTDLEPDLGLTHLDSGLVGQILVNLAVNARDAMPQGGVLTIRTRNHGSEWVRLEIADTGCGMDALTQARIFEPYFTTKPVGQGTGLGLATVFGIVQTSGGRIDFESAPGEGTTFRIDFPVAEVDITEIDTPVETPQEFVEGQETILLVEDDPNVRSLEQRILELQGYHVHVAESGTIALQLIEEGLRPDLLITDVVMPEMSGRELSERITQQFPQITILFLSGYTNDDVLRLGVLTEDANFLHKPFKPQELLTKIRKLLQRSLASCEGN